MQAWISRYFIPIFILLVLSWSSAFPVVKIGLSQSPPLLFAGLRTFLGGLFLLLPAWLWGGKFRVSQIWPYWLWSALFFVFLFFILQTYAVYYLPSGLTAVLIYLQPILVGLFARIWLKESLTWSKSIGLILGFTGVFFVSSEGVFGSLSLIGVLLGVGAALSWAIGTVYFKRIQERVSLLWLIAGQFVIGGLWILVLSLVFENWTEATWNVTFWSSILYTALFGISLAWVLYLALLQQGEASRMSANMFVVPLMSVLMGSLFLKEPVSLFLLLGGGLILTGIYLVNRRSSPAASREAEMKQKFS
jgi:drug/metabolite transporter (DMT)-like permease